MISFQSHTYYIFSLIAFCLFQLIRKKDKSTLLFFINLLFIGLFFYFSKKNLLILLTYVSLSYLSIFFSSKLTSKKVFIFFQITLSLIFLSFYKYDILRDPILSLFPNLQNLTGVIGFAGLSFLSFRSLSVMFDTLYGSRKKPLNFIHYTNFLLFFPCYLSGPLDRYDRFVGDLENTDTLDSQRIYQGLSRIVLGAFKKGILADMLYDFSSDSMSLIDMQSMSVSKILLSHYVYVFVLYFDFSGYSDIAIGISNLLGVKTPENFNKPYLQRNLQNFWNSWHISFLHWLRDYIYIPLQKKMIQKGFKNFVAIACFSYFTVFIIAGIWHGGTLQYFLYGVTHGLGLTVYLVYKKILEKKLTPSLLKWYRNSSLIKVMATLFTLHYFYLSLFFFIHKMELFSIIWNKL